MPTVRNDRPDRAACIRATAFGLAAFLSLSASGEGAAQAGVGSLSEVPVTGAAPAPASAASVPLPAATLEAARRALYVGYDVRTGLTGEAFYSPSLARRADDMLLSAFDAVGAADAPGNAPRVVASALLKPLGFPPSYTLLEVALLDPAGGGLLLRANLKVRVDSGEGDGRLTMALRPVAPTRAGPPADRAQAVVRFEVVVTESARALRHRFRASGDGIELLESLPVP